MAVCCERIFHHPTSFTILLSLTIFIYFGLQGAYNAGILTTLQREFKLKSSEIGMILIVNDIVGLIIVTPLSYLGAKSNRPRILGILTIIGSLGCIVSVIPQFIGNGDGEVTSVDGYNATQIVSPMVPPKSKSIALCLPNNDGDSDADQEQCTAEETAASGAQFDRAVWLIIGQVLFGIGAAGYFPLGITYIDDGVSKSSVSLHVAALFMMGSLSPLVAFSISAFTLSLHTDFYKMDADQIDYGDNDPRWIGAWWLGYLIYGGISILISIPFFFFPKEWPHKKDKAVELCEINVPLEKMEPSSPNVYMISDMMPSQEGSSIIAIVKGYFCSIGRLLTNVTYVSCMLAVCAQLAILAGFFSFVGRYIQTQYDVTPSSTSIILGCVLTPAGFFGNLLSGLIVKKLKLSMKGLAKMSVSICLVVAVLTPVNFAVGCGNAPIAGVTVPYPGENGLDISPSCLNECAECPSGVYTPVCGTDGIIYKTPCHAGCSQSEEGMEYDGTDPQVSHIYSECSCAGRNVTDGGTDEYYDDFTAVQGTCPRDCFARLVGFCVIFAVTTFINSLIKNPSFMLKLRSVDNRDRAMSLGFGSLALRILGFVPAPIYFGAAIQSTCLMFQESCGKTGNCLIYDMDGLRNMLFGLVLILKFVSVTCYAISALSIRRDKSGVYHPTELCRSGKDKVDHV